MSGENTEIVKKSVKKSDATLIKTQGMYFRDVFTFNHFQKSCLIDALKYCIGRALSKSANDLMRGVKIVYIKSEDVLLDAKILKDYLENKLKAVQEETYGDFFKDFKSKYPDNLFLCFLDTLELKNLLKECKDASTAHTESIKLANMFDIIETLSQRPRISPR